VVRIERTIVTSSAILARFGSSSEMSEPDFPCFLNLNGEARSFGVPLMNAKRSPLMMSSGMSWPSYFVNAGLGSNRSSCDGAPAMNR
jgi:hypothetical protein